MDPRFRTFYGPINEIPIEDQHLSFLSDRDAINTYNNETPILLEDPRSRRFYGSVNGIPIKDQLVLLSDRKVLKTYNETTITNTVLSSTVTSEEDPQEDFDSSDGVLSYISKILMEEDMDEKTFMLQESMNLQAEEKSFYDVIGQKYPPSPQQIPSFFDQNCDIPDEDLYMNRHSGTSSNDCESYNTGNSSNLHGRSESVWHFEKGVEEANKFLPISSGILVNFDPNGMLRGDAREAAVKVEGREEEREYSPIGSRGRKFSHREDDEEDLERERISKQAAVFPDPILRSEMFDTVLLCSMGEGEAALQAYRDLLKDKTSKKYLSKKGNKNRNKNNKRKEFVDLRTLLMNCAQAVASDDRRTSHELLKQIRHHSSPFGDGAQRLAHCFANGLEARLAGTGSSIYKSFVSRKTIASDYLKAYHLYLASCPFRKVSHMAASKTIIDKSVKSAMIHIVDFGILYGFQWPTLIQRLAAREGGTPTVRITGIEFPQPGFRPAAGVEETGRRLADYARMFDVPFEYNAVAKNWDSITLEDLKINKNEYLVVNSLYRFKNLHDETVLKKSSRNIVLDLIRKINPNLFVLGILNGSYGAPFFVTRFREVLFHFSALFDMLEVNVPQEHHERMLIEREIFGKEAMNVIACEGWERIERPETYKQWQVRNLRAGFGQIPFSREVIERAMGMVRTRYHKDFLIDEDSQWLIQGWKGRISYAISCWEPV